MITRTDEPILTISVASSLLKLHPRTLMMYERAGLTSPHRTTTNRRLFSLADLDHIQFVMHLTQKEGLNLQGVKVLLEAIRLSHEKGFDLRKALFPTFSPKKLL